MIDPAHVYWQKGRLEVDSSWWQLRMDITHYNGTHFLTLPRLWSDAFHCLASAFMPGCFDCHTTATDSILSMWSTS